MTDLTAPLTELRAAYRAYQNAKRDKKEEVTEKYRSQMEDEIRALVAAEKYAFAKRLKDMKEFYGLTVTDIQDHVLRTRNWKVWEDLRDFAGLEPESIIRENARAAERRENAAYVWTDTELIVKRNTLGVVLDPPVVYPVDTIRQTTDGKLWIADATDEAYEAEVMRADADNYVFMRALSAEIARHHAEQEKD